MEHTDNEVTIGELLRAIWSERRTIFIFALVAGLLGGMYAGYKFLRPGAPIEHSVLIQFSFKGAEQGEYPNGQAFNLSDVVSNQVVNTVYRQLEIAELGVELEDFSQAISVRPYAVNREFIVAKYKDRLNNSRLSQAEINDLEDAFQQELQAAARRAARITYASSATDTLSDDVIQQVLFRIPAEWSRISIEEQGVLDFAGFPQQPLQTSDYRDAEYIVGIYQVKDGIDVMQEALTDMQEDPRMSLVSDPKTGLTADDLSNRLNSIVNYQLSRLEKEVEAADVYRDRDSARLFFEGRLIELTDQLDVMTRKVRVYDENAQAFADMSRRSSNDSISAPESVTAQLGDQFLDQLLQLGDKVADAQFRQKLVTEKLELQVSVEELQGQVRRVERFLRLLATESRRQEERAAAVGGRYDAMLDEVAEMEAAYGRLIKQARASSLGSTGALYAALVEKAAVSSPFLASLKRTLLLIIVLVFMGAFLAVIVGLIKTSMRSERLD